MLPPKTCVATKRIAKRKILVLWKNFTLFLIDHFSVEDLLKTLLSPWHRDVIAKSWRGLHPGKFLKVHAENILSRFLGGIVRVVALLVFAILFVATQVLGGSIFVFLFF